MGNNYFFVELRLPIGTTVRERNRQKKLFTEYVSGKQTLNN